MKNPQLDLAIATEICGYPKDGWGAMINLKGNCVIYKKTSMGSAVCYQVQNEFSPTSDWKLAGELLEKHGVDLEQLLLNNIPGMVK